jgi:site-specific DNA-methyltransferase (adenine-specific)
MSASKIELLHADCMEYMRGLPDKAFDLAVVDPPYGINVTKMNMGSRKTVRPSAKIWDEHVPYRGYFEELKRVAKGQVIWGGNYFDLPPARCIVVWDKGESMYGRDFAECEIAWTSFDKVARIFKMGPNQLDRFHPTQKPVKLYEWLLTNYAKRGDKILDTHLGSASSAIAAHNLGFDFVGMELDADYYAAAKARYENHIKQIRMF